MLWSKASEKTEEIKRSAELVKKLKEREEEVPAVLAAWQVADQGPGAGGSPRVVDRLADEFSGGHP